MRSSSQRADLYEIGLSHRSGGGRAFPLLNRQEAAARLAARSKLRVSRRTGRELAGCGDSERFAHLLHPFDAQPRDAVGTQRHPDERHVVEGQNTIRGHPVGRAQRHFRGDAANGSGGRGSKHLIENGDRLIPSQDQERTSARARVLVPPDLTSRYHRCSCPEALSSASSR